MAKRILQLKPGFEEKTLAEKLAGEFDINSLRYRIAKNIVRALTPEKIAQATDISLAGLFGQLVGEIRATGWITRDGEVIEINGGGLTGLRSGQIIDEDDTLTHEGMALIRELAVCYVLVEA
jgi:hypothetical protein